MGSIYPWDRSMVDVNSEAVMGISGSVRPVGTSLGPLNGRMGLFKTFVRPYRTFKCTVKVFQGISNSSRSYKL